MESLEYSLYKQVMSHVNRQTYVFLYDLHTFYFSCLIIVTRTSSTVLNRSGKSRHHHLVLDIRR